MDVKESLKRGGSIKYWLFSIAVNAIILFAVMHYSQLMYETNDDFSISYNLLKGYPYVGFVNYYLCKILIIIQNIFGDVNIFVVSQIAVSYLAFTTVYKILLERSGKIFEAVFFTSVIVLFSLDHYCCIQFTKTSGLLMAVGLVYAVDAYISSRSLLSFLGGYLLYFLGVCYRQMGMYPALSYAGAFLLLWLVLNGREFFKGKRALREVGMLLVIAVLFAMPYGFDKLSDKMNASTPELAFAREYQAERVRVTDYPIFDNYETHKKEYDKAGIDRDDIRMIDRFALDYDGGATLENLKTINKINVPIISKQEALKEAATTFVEKTRGSLSKMNFIGMHIAVLAMVCALIILISHPRNWIYVPLIALLTVALHIYIYYNGRANFRAFYVANISAVMWLMYIAALAFRSDDANKWWRKWPGRIACVLISLTMFYFMPNGIDILKLGYEDDYNIVETQEMSEYLQKHPENLYIMPTPIQKYPRTLLEPLKPPTMQENCTNTGGWETLTPFRMEFLKKYGISNPIKDAIDNPKVLFFGKYKHKLFKTYYNKWYGSDTKKVKFEKVDEVGDIEIFRVITVDSY